MLNGVEVDAVLELFGRDVPFLMDLALSALRWAAAGLMVRSFGIVLCRVVWCGFEQEELWG